MDTDARLAAIAVTRAVATATDTTSPIAERVMHRTGLNTLLNGLTHDECERVTLQLASFVIGISGTTHYPLDALLAWLRNEAVEHAAKPQ